MLSLHWWPCEAEAPEACYETEVSTLASSEASTLLMGSNSDILRGIQVLAYKWVLGLNLEKAWGKVQQWLMKLRLKK